VTSLRITPGLAPDLPGSGAASAVVLRFLAEVRLTGDEEAAQRLMAARVSAHQIISERDETVVRTPAEYAAHARDLLTETGDASFEITELLSEADRIYIRWLLTRPASRSHGPGLREVGSAVYRVECGRLAEYWIQLDRYAAALREQILQERE
jgi:hypothetical protein